MEDIVKCIFCKKLSKKDDWKVERQKCELCGAHNNHICPHCGDGDELAYTDATEEEFLNFHYPASTGSQD